MSDDSYVTPPTGVDDKATGQGWVCMECGALLPVKHRAIAERHMRWHLRLSNAVKSS